ncbi:MAG: fibronectin type III domain-containing protein [Bacteroidales bacterium]|nr:fibronectin type III domain-containing protein [Bacteroidales bacterium]
MNILKKLIEMRRNNVVGGAGVLHRGMIVICLMLMAIAGNTMAQGDKQYVIRSGAYYLAHVYNETTSEWELEGVTALNPNCIWYSKNTRNYYFLDGSDNKIYLKSTRTGGAAVTLSEPNPAEGIITPDNSDYYFWDWDWGLALGVQTFPVPPAVCDNEDLSDDGTQCWTVYWVEYYDGAWKMSSTKHYNPGSLAANFRRVRVTEHDEAVSGENGGLGNLANFSMEYNTYRDLSINIEDYSFNSIPAYTTMLLGELSNCGSNWVSRSCDTDWVVHNYWGDVDHLSATPASVPSGTLSSSSATYSWSITGEGATYLSFANGSDVTTSTAATPRIYYRNENKSGDKTATLTLTVTYGSGGPTQTRTATITVVTECGHPSQAADPVVAYDGVTVSWIRTSDNYNVCWKTGSGDWTCENNVGDVTSFTIRDLEYGTTYQYKVEAICSPADASAATLYEFSTKATPGTLIFGSVFGGGRMASVAGNTEVVIINCDTIGAVYGGNDIFGNVEGSNGSKITLGVDAGDSYESYGTTSSTVKVRVGSVYGGGNGYYAYNGSSFVAATNSYTEQEVANNGEVKAMTLTHKVGETVWTNSGATVTKTFPSIKKTMVVVKNDLVTVDSIFGGAKNAFISNDSDTITSIRLLGGTVYSVFGGNNWGGTLSSGSKQHITVYNTKTDYTNALNPNTKTTGFGRDFGVRYMFGGGNLIEGQNVHIEIKGGQIDTCFGGGNRATIAGLVKVDVNCNFSSGTEAANNNWALFGNTITKALYNSTTIDRNYAWNGKGLYNVRTLFGGNNAADMSQVPTIALTSGGVGTVYGGGNSGRMLANTPVTIAMPNITAGQSDVNKTINYGTHVVMESANTNMYVDNLYGGCQKSDVLYSTLVEVKGGNVGNVYGGCNISGDVGSTRVNQSDSYVVGVDIEYQEVQGATYVILTGGKVQKNVYAGSNGFYHCNDGYKYVDGIDYDDPEHNYTRTETPIPTHNETNVIVRSGATVYGNVYAGGNLACVGFPNAQWAKDNNYPVTVGLASVRMDGGTVAGNLFGGGNMASIYGINEVLVSGGIIGGAVYGGNDRTGTVAHGENTNRIKPSEYEYASDDNTSLTDLNVRTYVGISGSPKISTVFGGGNGDYDYTGNGDMQYCQPILQPIQNNTFVDIHTNGSGDAEAEIETVYGGGDGVTVEGFIKVFVNIQNPNNTDDIGTIFGGNNKGDLEDLLPDIILLHGKVNTVYGGCNEGAMVGGVDMSPYGTVSSCVHLLSSYTANGVTITPDAEVTNAVYGGCRMNNVEHNTLVLIDGGNHPNAAIYGGCDISGIIGGTSQVVTNGGTVGVVYGGGNGDYTYDRTGLTVYDGETLVATGSYNAPQCTDVQVDILGGTIGAVGTATTADVVFGGGLGQETSTTGTTTVNIGPASGTTGPSVYGSVYGGSALGEVNTTEVNIRNGHIYSSVYGGGLGDTIYPVSAGHSNIPAKVNGNAVVNIGTSDQESNGVIIDYYVFGGNNNNGSPAGTATVNVYKTAHTSGTPNNAVPSDELTVDEIPTTWPLADESTDPGSSNDYYALMGVYGGGNLAHKASSTACTVHVWHCDNSIKYVYGGGKAADLAGNANVIVDGGHIYQVFGGGDGSVTGTYANITGSANTTINGGYLHYVFGGSNTRGNIGGSQNITIAELTGVGSCYPPVIDNFFAGGNLAAIGTTEHPAVLNTSVTNCNVKFGNFYGGANRAKIIGNVTINISGGTYRNIFGGSNAAPIIGNVTVNFYGGKVTNIYGGNNTSGQISGNIVVNVEKNTTCGIFSIDNVYGGGNLAPYDSIVHSGYPQVNIKHTGTSPSETVDRIHNDVFGGGLGSTAIVKGNPQVTIGGTGEGNVVTIHNNVYGGGSQAEVDGNTNVKVIRNSTIDGNVYGGGNEAKVTGDTNVEIGEN